MLYRLLTIAVLLLIAPAGCCHPCCQRPCGSMCGPACAPMPVGPPACGCVPNGGLRGHLQGQLSYYHSWFKPPRPAEITPPIPRFHPVPARPVFEYPPDEFAPISAEVPQPLR